MAGSRVTPADSPRRLVPPYALITVGLPADVDDTDNDDWLFRRDSRVRRPIQSLTGRASTISYAVLSPDVQLLYKSKGLREKDVADFRAVLPCLLAGERDWLRTALKTVSPRHPWIPELRDSARA